MVVKLGSKVCLASPTLARTTKSAKNLHHTSGVSKKSYMNNEILELYEKNPMAFFAILRRYRTPSGRLPDTDTIFYRLLEDINY